MQDTPGEVGTSSLVMYSYGPLHTAEQKQGDQLELSHRSSDILSIVSDLFKDLVDPWALYCLLILSSDFTLDIEGSLLILAEGSLNTLPGLS